MQSINTHTFSSSIAAQLTDRLDESSGNGDAGDLTRSMNTSCKHVVLE